MNAKGILPALGLGMVAGAALGMALKPRDQAMIKRKAGHAMKAVGNAVEDLMDSAGMH